LRKSPVRWVPHPLDRERSYFRWTYSQYTQCAAEAFADSMSIAVATSTAGILVSLN
jgi:hypothetical protein